MLLPSPDSVTGAPSVLVKWRGDAHDFCEVHIGSRDQALSADGWDSGVIRVPSGKALRTVWSRPSGDLQSGEAYYVFVRIHNANGWSDWSARSRRFRVGGRFPTDVTVAADGPGGQAHHSICHNPVADEYLLAYGDSRPGEPSRNSYCILGTATGAMKDGAVTHAFASDAFGFYGLRGPLVAYNSVLNEYLLVFVGWVGEVSDGKFTPDLHDKVYGVRIRPGGEPKGQPQLLKEVPWLRAPALAFSTHKPGEQSPPNVFLLAWQATRGGRNWPDDGSTRAFTIVPDGETGLKSGPIMDLSEEPALCANPRLAFNPDLDEFLVAFEMPREEQGYSVDIVGQRVTTSGNLTGGNFDLVHERSWDTNGDLVYVPELREYLQVYAGSNSVGSVWGQFLNGDGTKNGPRFIIQDSDHPGGWGPLVTWHPRRHEFLVSWCAQEEDFNFARRVSADGKMLCDPFRFTGNVVGRMGNFTPFPLANTRRDDYLICWHHTYDTVYTRRYAPPSGIRSPQSRSSGRGGRI